LDGESHHRLKLAKDFPGWNAPSSVALRHQPFVAGFVPGRIAAAVVGFAVDLDGEVRFQADEIEDERPGRMLPSPFEPTRSFAQLAPEQHLGERHFPPKLARLADGRAWSGQHRASPSTVLRTVPLPVPGRILGRCHPVIKSVLIANRGAVRDLQDVSER
jgi:hypothetical protein